MYLGIDPGVRKLGYGLVDKDLNVLDAGILLQDQKNPTRKDQFQRIDKIYNFFCQMCQDYDIDKVGIEKLYFTKCNQANAEFVYGIRGSLMRLFVDQGIEFYEHTPNQIKKYVTGNGKAWKKLVQNFVKKLFDLEKVPEYNDTADALGLAYMISKK